MAGPATRTLHFPADHAVGSLKARQATRAATRPNWWNNEASYVSLGDAKGDVQVPLDAELAHVAAFPRLVELDLSATQVTDAGLLHLEKLPALQTFERAIRCTAWR